MHECNKTTTASHDNMEIPFGASLRRTRAHGGEDLTVCCPNACWQQACKGLDSPRSLTQYPDRRKRGLPDPPPDGQKSMVPYWWLFANDIRRLNRDKLHSARSLSLFWSQTGQAVPNRISPIGDTLSRDGRYSSSPGSDVRSSRQLASHSPTSPNPQTRT
jgi:hypothetical protein